MENFNMIDCEHCGCEIKEGVSKCYHCGSFHGLKGMISHWGTTLSILLALTSLVSLVIPPAIAIIKGDYSNLSATIVDANSSSYEILLTNTGNRPTALIDLGVSVTDTGGNTPYFPIHLEQESSKVISEGKSMHVVYSSPMILPAMVRIMKDQTDMKESNCKLTVNFSQFNDTKEEENIEFSCYYTPMKLQGVILEAHSSGKAIPGLSTVIKANGSTYLLPRKETLIWAEHQISKKSSH